MNVRRHINTAATFYKSEPFVLVHIWTQGHLLETNRHNIFPIIV